MRAVQDWKDDELDNLIANYKGIGKTDDPYYLELIAEHDRRKGRGLVFDTTMRAVLAAAREGRFISYGQLSDASGVEWSKVRYAMNRHLQGLIEFCHHKGWPLISAIVVTQDNLETGAMDERTLNGFVSGCKTVGYVIADPESFLREQQEKVFKWAAKFNEFDESTPDSDVGTRPSQTDSLTDRSNDDDDGEPTVGQPDKLIPDLADADGHQNEDSFGRVFFTYVWGAPGDPAWPLTFASKAARSHAKKVLSEGDIVFTVGTRSEPTPEQFRGNVLGAYKVSGLEVNTQDYVDRDETDEVVADAISRFPYALHPIEVQAFDPPSDLFAELVGPLTPNHHLQAQSKVVELDTITAEPLLRLQGRQVALSEPKSLLGRGRIAQHGSKLAPKHEGDFKGRYGDHELWYVYVLALRDQRGKCFAFKLGYSSDTNARLKAHNKPMATEVTGLEWEILVDQPTSSEDDARTVEQLLLRKFSAQRLQSNGEIVTGVKETELQTALAAALREN